MSLPAKIRGRDGCFQQFEWGVVVAQPPQGPLAIRAGIYMHYAKLGGLSSWLGLPLSEEELLVNGEVIAHFESDGRSLPAPKVRPMQEVV